MDTDSIYMAEFAEVKESLRRVEEKIDHKLDDHEKRIRWNEMHWARAKGVLLCLSAIGAIIGVVVGVFFG